MKNINSEHPYEHWSFLDAKDKIVLDMGCSFYDATYNPGMLSSAEWFVQTGANVVIGFDANPYEVNKYNIVYKNNPKYKVFQLFVDSKEKIKNLLNHNPQIIKCDIEGGEIYFNDITKEEMECVEQIGIEYHDAATKKMCEQKLLEWEFDFVEQYSLMTCDIELQGVFCGKKTKTLNTKKAKVPKILYIGNDKPELKSIQYESYEDCSLEVKYIKNDENVNEIISSFKPDAILTIGTSDAEYKNLFTNTYDIRKKWLHLDKIDEYTGQYAYNCAMNQLLNQDNTKLISYFTSTYNTGVRLYETYQSLVNQTYKDWEWVLVDDSNDAGKTLSIIKNIASQDHRVKVYSFEEKSGNIIGEAKYRAATLCRGFILAELDHDDLLTQKCTEYLVNASQKFPDAGFFYTDSAEINQYWKSQTYEKPFALWYGEYRKVNYNGYNWDVATQPNINPKTIRHIVGVPNHVRAWRRDVYFQIGGHNRDLSIADDYELIIRTFLHTKMVKIAELGYIQFIHDSGEAQNSHDIARADIQRRVKTIMYHYNDRIAKRFEELGIEDYVYNTDKNNPLDVQSRFGDDENYVNYIYDSSI
jgi:glycosyltransferase involved in cell wall biosynthesis